MKRTLSLILVLILALSLCCTSAYAKTKPSKESDVEVDEPTTKPDKPPVIVDEPPVNPPEVEDTTVPQITEEIASGILVALGNDVPAKDLEVIWQKEINPGEAGEVKLHADGASEDNPFYVFKWNGNQWEYVMTVATEDFTLTLNDAANIALVLEKPAAVPASVVTSPKTGVNGVVLAALAAATVLASAAYVALRKEN